MASNNKKAQSAMEYLMTYGWALLVIVIIVAVLLFINPFGSTDTCIFESSSFHCSGQRLLAKDPNSEVSNVLYAQISSGAQKSVEIIGIACTPSSQVPNIAADGNFQDKVFRLPSPITLAHSGSLNTGAIENSKFQLQCLRLDSSANIMESQFGANEKFSGNIYVLYRMQGDAPNIPPKMSKAKVAVIVQ